jgi:hypothetical protein
MIKVGGGQVTSIDPNGIWSIQGAIRGDTGTSGQLIVPSTYIYHWTKKPTQTPMICLNTQVNYRLGEHDEISRKVRDQMPRLCGEETSCRRHWLKISMKEHHFTPHKSRFPDVHVGRLSVLDTSNLSFLVPLCELPLCNPQETRLA